MVHGSKRILEFHFDTLHSIYFKLHKWWSELSEVIADVLVQYTHIKDRAVQRVIQILTISTQNQRSNH